MKKFKTESQKLLDLMINSIYTNKEIFLRELISNASDAVDKLYFKSLTDSSIEVVKDDLVIRVSYDQGARIVTISDNGIGMTKEELDLNLGTIAHSDSLGFKTENAEAQGGDLDIIGQFGVGFYSAFMVASKVNVVSRAYGSEEAYEWESDGIEGYTIRKAERLDHGTDVILMLKEDTADETYTTYCTEYGLRDLIERYSNYVRYPIQMRVTKQREMPKPANAPEDYKPQYESYQEIETINSMIPIWKRSKAEVTDEEYNEFYMSTFHDWSEPVRRMTIKAEGTLNYDALLFIPGKAPYDMYTREYEKGLALYSSNVLIMDKCADLLPDYFGFVRGVVDSQDLTLNISRETLQQNSQLRAIARRVEKKVQAELEKMRDDAREEYEEFFKNFGRSIKFGVYSSYGQGHDELNGLLLFYSAKQQKMITLAEYVEDMQEDQKEILYASGESRDLMAKMPIVSAVLEKGFDVLLCDEDVDEFCLQSMHIFQDKEMKNVAAGELDLDSEEEKAQIEETNKENTDLFEAMKAALDGKVERVSASTRLSGVPACLTTDGPISFEMERVMSVRSEMEGFKSGHVLELNPEHEVFGVLQAAHQGGDSEKLGLYTQILYGQARLIQGMQLDDPVEYAKAVSQLMK